MKGQLAWAVLPERKNPALSVRVQKWMKKQMIVGFASKHFAEAFTKVSGIVTMVPELRMVVYRNSRNPDPDAIRLALDYGVVGYNKVTLDFVREFVDHLSGVGGGDSALLWGMFKYHGVGTDTTAESSDDTSLGAEVGARVAGTSTEGDTHIYQSVGTWLPSSAGTVKEHGLFDTDTPPGLMMDRTVLAAEATVTTDDSIQFTYSLTVNYGG
jgi:hypothetical protein